VFENVSATANGEADTDDEEQQPDCIHLDDERRRRRRRTIPLEGIRLAEQVDCHSGHADASEAHEGRTLARWKQDGKTQQEGREASRCKAERGLADDPVGLTSRLTAPEERPERDHCEQEARSEQPHASVHRQRGAVVFPLTDGTDGSGVPLHQKVLIR